jgi:signal transduction histidine kinase
MLVFVNQMAAQLETAERQRRGLDILRRELVAWVGQDLRTPMTLIRVMVEALSDGVVKDPTAVERCLQAAQHNTRSLSRLLDDHFAHRADRGGGMELERQSSSIRGLLSDAIETFSTAAGGQGVRLKGSNDPAAARVVMDAPKIERVLANLINNALQHTPAGGVVHVGASEAPGGVRVEVRDTGEGIRDENLSRVFERFYWGEEDRRRNDGGAGLGLAIAKGDRGSAQCAIATGSTVGQGTYLWFTLPR